MVNQQTLQGNWNEIKGNLKKKWGALTNDDLQSFDGNVDRLIGMIQRKTGEARSQIEQFLDELTTQGSSAFSDVAENVREYAHVAADKVQETTRQAAESIRQGYEEAETFVRQRPTEAVAVCFGVGVFVGLVLGLAMRRN